MFALSIIKLGLGGWDTGLENTKTFTNVS